MTLWSHCFMLRVLEMFTIIWRPLNWAGKVHLESWKLEVQKEPLPCSLNRMIQNHTTLLLLQKELHRVSRIWIRGADMEGPLIPTSPPWPYPERKASACGRTTFILAGLSSSHWSALPIKSGSWKCLVFAVSMLPYQPSESNLRVISTKSFSKSGEK